MDAADGLVSISHQGISTHHVENIIWYEQVVLKRYEASSSFIEWRPYAWGRPINYIYIEFEIRPKFAVTVTLVQKKKSTDQNQIKHTSRKLHCRHVCKISL